MHARILTNARLPCFQLGTGASRARHEDTSSLKHNILVYLLRDPSEDFLDPPITKMDPKSVRGFNHIATADCLCPMEMHGQFLKDPMYVRRFSSQVTRIEQTCSKFMEKVNNGSHRIKTSGWPRFLYDMAIPYDRKNMDQGLFRGPILVRVGISTCGCHSILM